MALLTVEIPERLLAKLKRTGRPAQEVIVEALEETLNHEAVDEEIASLSPAAQALDQGEHEGSSTHRRRAHKPEAEDLPHEEVVRRLSKQDLSADRRNMIVRLTVSGLGYQRKNANCVSKRRKMSISLMLLFATENDLKPMCHVRKSYGGFWLRG